MEIRRCKECPAIESKPGGREGGFPICICHLHPTWVEVNGNGWCVEGQEIGRSMAERRRAQIEALVTEREQMLVANCARARNGEAQMYGEQQFADCARRFVELAS